MLTKIEWVDHSANPIRVKGGKVWPHGYHCTKVSPGCAHCYAERLNIMRGTGLPFDDRKVEFYLDLSVFDNLPKTKPTTVFVQSMGDLLHKDVPDEFIDTILNRCAFAVGHTFLILTKRPERAVEIMKHFKLVCPSTDNIWPGVTVESPEYLWRIDELLKIPAARRFVSFEPLLGDIDFKHKYDFQSFSWCVIGAESGPKRRRCDIGWVRHIAKQCEMVDIPVFIKQLHIKGLLSKNPDEWPKDLRVREFPG